MEAIAADDGWRPTVARLPLTGRIKNATFAFVLQRLILAPALFIQDVKDYMNPPESRPDIVKSYPCRKGLPIRCDSRPSRSPAGADRTNRSS